MKTEKPPQVPIPLVVTTLQKGVFFGYGVPSTKKTIRLTNAQMCIYWSASVKGVLGLASTGPNQECRITPIIPAITLQNVTSIMECSKESEEMEITTLELSNNYGNSYGYGYGDGDILKYLQILFKDIPHPPKTTLAIWRCNEDNTPANGGTKTIAREGLTEKISGPLKICTKNALHGTLNPSNWKGSNYWIVALHHPIQKQNDKLASLKRTFIKNMGKCPF
jgi:hypothetical protein